MFIISLELYQFYWCQVSWYLFAETCYRCVLQDCVVYTGAIVETGCSLTYCLIGPHHIVPASSSGNHQILTETTDNMITLG